jgi:hypothetical protein
MLLKWEDVRKGDLIALSGQYYFIFKVKEHGIEGPPPGPERFWSVYYIDSFDSKSPMKTFRTFQPEAMLVQRKR